MALVHLETTARTAKVEAQVGLVQVPIVTTYIYMQLVVEAVVSSRALAVLLKAHTAAQAALRVTQAETLAQQLVERSQRGQAAAVGAHMAAV
jgi:hypothetical protein